MTMIQSKMLSAGMTMQNITAKPGARTPELREAMKEAFHPQMQAPDAEAPAAENPVYATVTVQGKIVATIYESGAAMSSNAVYAQTKDLPSMGDKETLSGINLAQKRAKEIALALGGTIDQSTAAKTYSAQWEQNEKLTAYYTALDAGAKTKADAQLLGQDEKTPVDKFFDLVGSDKSTAEKMYARIVAALGLTDADVANMTPEELAALNEKIKEMIKQQAELDRAEEAAKAEKLS